MTPEEIQKQTGEVTVTGNCACADILALAQILLTPARDKTTGAWRAECDFTTASQLIASAQCSFKDFQDLATAALGDLSAELERRQADAEAREEAARLRKELRAVQADSQRSREAAREARAELRQAKELALAYIHAYDDLRALTTEQTPSQRLSHAVPSAHAQETARRLNADIHPIFREEGAARADIAETKEHSTDTPAEAGA